MVAQTAFNGMRLIAGTGASAFAAKVSAHFDAPLAQTEIGCFPDGEAKVHLVDDIRGSDVFILQCFDEQRVYDQLMELFILIDCARRASAARITAVIPDHLYGRQDRKDKPRVPITAKLVANIISASGADRILTIDLHAAQIEKSYITCVRQQVNREHFIAFNGMRLIAGTGASAFATKVAVHLDAPLTQTEIGCFPGNIHGSDVFILQCFGERKINEWLIELFALIDGARRASAARVTAVIPYHPYGRQDRKDKPRVPITAKLVANIISVLGADRALTMDLHAAQIQGFYDIPVDHLYGRPVLGKHFTAQGLREGGPLVVVGSDFGASKMARRYAEMFGTSLALLVKRRIDDRTVVIENIVSDVEVEGLRVLLVDDIVSTGGTLGDGARFLKKLRVRDVYVCATHGVFCGKIAENLAAAPIDGVFVTDTVPCAVLPPKVEVVSAAPLIGEAIRLIHSNKAVGPLFD